jgi:hypothetical protein
MRVSLAGDLPRIDLVGLEPVLRMAVAADWPGVGAWVGAILFFPSLALALSMPSRTHRLFQAVYLALWYAAVNRIPAADSWVPFESTSPCRAIASRRWRSRPGLSGPDDQVAVQDDGLGSSGGGMATGPSTST